METLPSLPALPERLTVLLDTIPVPAALALGPLASAVRVNAAMAELAGDLPERFVDAPLREALAGKPVHAARLDISRPDGSVRHMIVTAKPLYDDDGAACGAIAILQDVGQHVETERFLRELARLTPALLFTADSRGIIDFVNERWSEVIGEPAHLLLADGWTRFVHPDDLERLTPLWKEAVESGRHYVAEWRFRNADGSYRWIEIRAEPERNQHGEIVRWFGSGTDIDARVRLDQTARRERVQRERSLRLFIDIGDALSKSLDLRTSLAAVLRLSVPEFADWAFVDLNEPDGTRRRVAVHPKKKRAEPAGVVEIPILVGDEMRGTLGVARDESRGVFDGIAFSFFHEVARRIAPAIVNAELYERERRVARSFQEAALPARLPEIPGYRFDAIYEAARAEAVVGGDWYDAFPLTDGRIVVSIGDVAGTGLQAAVTMANVRQAIRGISHVHADPSLMLEAADRALRADEPDRFVTAFVGVIDPIGATLSYANAGHPPPYMRDLGGAVTRLELGGVPLGLFGPDQPPTKATEFLPGSMLVLYTDGLTESTHNVEEGEGRLEAVLARGRIFKAQRPATALKDVMLREGSHDDVAILVVQADNRTAARRWAFDARDAADAERVRNEVIQALRDGDYPVHRLGTAEMILGELSANVFRYAAGPAQVVLEWELGHAPVIHVIDLGPGFRFSAKLPKDIFSESGRGLFLVSSLAADMQVWQRQNGGSHARVVLKD